MRISNKEILNKFYYDDMNNSFRISYIKKDNKIFFNTIYAMNNSINIFSIVNNECYGFKRNKVYEYNDDIISLILDIVKKAKRNKNNVLYRYNNEHIGVRITNEAIRSLKMKEREYKIKCLKKAF